MSRTWPEMFQRQVWVRLFVTGGQVRCHGQFGPPIVPYAPPSGPLSAHTRQRGGGGGRKLFFNCKTPLFQGIAHSALFIAQ
jgi:hypothetical protein